MDKTNRNIGASRRLIRLSLIVLIIGVLSMVALAQSSEEGQESASDVLARGAGTTIIEGGTGSPNFTPVLTKVAFHAEKNGGVVSGDFECLALSPPVGTGAGSGSFTVNAMYVTGTISSAVVNDHTVTLSGTATITGLGAGTAVPFTFVTRSGGPGTAAVLTTAGSPHLVFKEILLEGSFHVPSH